MKINKLLICFILLIVIPLISSVSLGTFKTNDCVNLIQTCSNCTYVNITSVVYPNSSVALSNVEMTKSGTYYSYSFCNTSLNGIYIATGFGDPDGSINVWNYDFTITPNGEEASIGKAVFYIGLLIMLIIFLVGCVYLFMNNDNLLSKVGFLGLGYLFLIAITFISWNMAKDFLTSSPFLVDMFRILFFVLMICVFPLFIGAFAWWLIMAMKTKEIERMMNKGMSYDEANKRQGRKYK